MIEIANEKGMSMDVTSKGITEDCLVFRDRQGKFDVNVIPLDKLLFVPRVGEQVSLPGDDDEGGGQYRVEAIHHYFREESNAQVDRGDVTLLNITADVTKL